MLTKRGSDTIHDVIPTKYQKYPSNTILKHVNVLAKVNKLPRGSLHSINPHDAYIITINALTMTLSNISYEKKE